MALISNLVISALSRIVGEEIAAWSPRICRALTNLAINCLPENRRARYGEEWQSHVNEVPGMIAKFLASAGFLVAASKIRLESPGIGKFDRWMQTVAQLRDSHSKAITVINKIADDDDLAFDERLRPFVDKLRVLMHESTDLHNHLWATLKQQADESLSQGTTLKLGRFVVQELVYHRKIKLIQQGFEDMSRGAQRIGEMSDQIVEILSNKRKG